METMNAVAVVEASILPSRGTRGVTIGQAIAAVVDAKTQGGCRPISVKALRQYLVQFAKGRESWPLESFTVEVIEEWFAGRRETPSTRQSNQGRLSSLFAYCERRQWIERNPTKFLEPVRIDRKAPFILSPRQAASLLDYARRHKPQQLAFWTLALLAGVRPDELLRVTWDAVNLSDGTVTIDAAASKVRRRRIIALEPSAELWLKLAKERGALLPVKRMSRRRYLTQAKRLLGFPVWPHDCCRHTSASFLLALHRDAGRVAQLLGNSAGVLERHYKQIVTAKQCSEFWSFTPESPLPETPKTLQLESPIQLPADFGITIDPTWPLERRVEAVLAVEPAIRARARLKQRNEANLGSLGRKSDSQSFLTIREMARLAGCGRHAIRRFKRLWSIVPM